MTVTSQPHSPVPPPGGQFLHDFLLAAGRTAPDSPAVIEPAESGHIAVTSYRDLENQRQYLAAELKAAGLGTGDRVLLESDTSATAIAALLACSSLGATFIPVSPESPRMRLLSIVAATDPAFYLHSAETNCEGIPQTVGSARFTTTGLTVERPPATRLRHRTAASVTDPAYIIFTSGSTGRPKGVVMSHRAVVSFYHGMLAQKLVTTHDRVASTSPLQFDFSLLNIGLALGTGAAVVPVPPALARWPRRFLGALQATETTQVNGVPSMWRQSLRREPERLAALDQLRGVLFCGEDFPLPEVRRLQELRPGIRLVNCYGSTESMACSFAEVPYPLPAETQRLSIGCAHRGAEAMLVDESGNLITEPDAVGEILLRSPALFTGYWDDPEGTRAALVPDPLDPRSGQAVLRTGDLAYRGERGELYFCGRKDNQVQIRGNRVELPEIERRLLQFPGTVEAAVLLLEPPGEEATLGAFVVLSPQASQTTSAAELSAFCSQALPTYMIPKRLQILEELPTTANGKVDRAALTARWGQRETVAKTHH